MKGQIKEILTCANRKDSKSEHVTPPKQKLSDIEVKRKCDLMHGREPREFKRKQISRAILTIKHVKKIVHILYRLAT